MRVISVYNNNVVLAKSEDGEEIIALGSGIGFQKKPGSKIDKDKITKTFLAKDEERNNIMSLLSRIPTDVFELTHDIIEISLGEKSKNKENLIIVLADHINVALERSKENKFATNLVLSEIKILYTEQFEQGLKALELIEERTGIKLPEDEAGYIAMHLANAITDEEEKPSLLIHFVKDVMLIIKYSLNIELSENNIAYQRLSTHLRFLGNRIFRNKVADSVNDQTYALYILMRETNRIENRAVEQIADYVKENYNYELNDDEKLYLLIHITRFNQDLK